MPLLILGTAITLATWLALRRVAGAPLAGPPERHRIAILLLDSYPPLAGFALGTLMTARPLLASLAMASTGAGLALADIVKRKVLREPALFSDRAELIEVVRHPRLYLAFIGTGKVAAAAAACLVIVAGFFWLEPPLWRRSWPVAIGCAVAALAVGRALFVVPRIPALLRASKRLFERWEPTRDPEIDTGRFGLFATFIAHATIAGAERPARQQAAQARPIPPLPEGVGPILLVQGESFMDAGRLHPELAPLTANFRRLQGAGARHGQLAVPCWGANTIRSELSVLSGLGAGALGLDRFNPYEHFARVPLPSLAQAARAAGYHTVCVHPYERSFYARDRVMPMLGFDEFIGLEGFAAAPTNNGYVTDVAVAERIATLVREHGPRLFLFAISMENHGPWSGFAPGVALPEAIRTHCDAGPLSHWLGGLAASDAMIPILAQALEDAGAGWLLFYGDHQPSLPAAFAALGHDRRDTDYAIWSPLGSHGAERDLAAEELGPELLACIAAQAAASPAVSAAAPEVPTARRTA